jgi:beta-lactamase class A
MDKTNSCFLGVRLYLLILAIFVSGFGTGYFLFYNNSPHEVHIAHQVRQGGYKYINPLLECELFEDESGFTQIKPFKDKLQKIVDENLRAGAATHISVYFRDLNNGPWFGLNEKESFAPASLLKVPVMMTYLKKAETDPGLLARKLLFKERKNTVDENIDKSLRLVPGTHYTVDELISRMIAHSDNDSMMLLNDNLDLLELSKLLDDLLTDVQANAGQDFMTVRNYGCEQIRYDEADEHAGGEGNAFA